MKHSKRGSNSSPTTRPFSVGQSVLVWINKSSRHSAAAKIVKCNAKSVVVEYMPDPLLSTETTRKKIPIENVEVCE